MNQFCNNAEPYLFVIDSSIVLQLRTSLSVAGVAENKWCRILVETLYKFKGYGAKK